MEQKAVTDKQLELLEEIMEDNKDVLSRLAIIEEQESSINDLISLVLWSTRRLPSTYKSFAYEELISIIGENHKYLECVKDEISELLKEEN